MNKTIVDTWTANIYLGLKERNTGRIFTISEVKEICQEYVNTVKLCVSVTETTYIYVDGSEFGVIVGLIQYPRFPEEERDLKEKATSLAEILKNKFKQLRVSIVMKDETIMLS